MEYTVLDSTVSLTLFTEYSESDSILGYLIKDEDNKYSKMEDYILLVKKTKVPYMLKYKEKYITNKWVVDWSVPVKTLQYVLVVSPNDTLPEKFINSFKSYITDEKATFDPFREREDALASNE